MDFTRIHGVLFDFDGVLADTAADITSSVNATLEHFGFEPLPQEQVISFVGNGAKKLLKRSITASIRLSKKNPAATPVPDFEEIYNWYLDYYHTHSVENTEFYPGAMDLLDVLSTQDIPAAIVSNKPHKITAAILQKMEVTGYFDAIIGPEQTSQVKPAPDGLLLAMEHINNKRQEQGKPAIPPENFLMVGDSHTDIEAGRNAGTKTCALTGGYGNKEKLATSQPDTTFQMVCELLVHLQHPSSL